MPSLRTLLRTTGADPRLLTLEVTEGLVIDDFDDVVSKMRELVALGVEFALDDFGTGYSSLAYLKRLPIQELKIDRSFVSEAPSNKDDGALVEAILTVASQLVCALWPKGWRRRSRWTFWPSANLPWSTRATFLGTPSLWTNGWPDRLPICLKAPGRAERSTWAAGCCSVGLADLMPNQCLSLYVKAQAAIKKEAISPLLAALAPWVSVTSRLTSRQSAVTSATVAPHPARKSSALSRYTAKC